ncbi:unnamed protein product, partial [Pylaiella littoralis]
GGGAAASGGTGGEKKKLFPIRNMNVMNPLDSDDNQIDDTVNRRRAARMHSLLQMGARQLRPVLMHLQREVTKAQQGQPGPPHPAHLHTTSVAMLETFFTLSWARFGQGWRPDVPPHLDSDHEKTPWSTYDHDYNFFGTVGAGAGPNDSLLNGEERAGGGAERGDGALVVAGPVGAGGSKHRDPFHVDLQSVRDSVKYCCFLLEAEVTDSALLALSKEILSGKGSLPVGEIGKLLQEATANASLSQTLKDQFGGLKKFLEKYPGEFVIAADHPFNPHVYLKSTLSPEELDTVMRGGTVVQIGNGGVGGGAGGAGSGGGGGGGAKKHKSKSGRRRSAAKQGQQLQQQGQPLLQQQQQQQQQQHHHPQHQAAGGVLLQQQHQQQQQIDDGHLRVRHAPISQQQRDEQQQQQQQQQMRAPNEPMYRHHQRQQQLEAMRSTPHARHENNTSCMLSHRERQQQQQQGMPRQGIGRGGGGVGGSGLSCVQLHKQQQQQQQLPPSQLPQHVRSGFNTVAAPPRIPARPPATQQQRQLSPPPGQHHEQGVRRRQQQQQQQRHHHQQQQRQEGSLAALYKQQSPNSLVTSADLFRDEGAQPQR